jgi:uncharacterized protein YjbJ (UPF0337 family)
MAMSASDKVKHKIDQAAGKAKEEVGKAADDRSTEDEGRAQQAKGDLGTAGEKVKDAFKR